MAVSTRALADGFRAIVGPAHTHDDSRRCEAVAVDGIAPRLLVAPASTDEVTAVVALAANEALAVVPRGSGSAQEMGRPVERVDLVLDLTRLDRILEYTPDDLTITVQAGVTAASLSATLGTPGQWLPVDPPGAATRTLGGLTATNASGPLRARYGTLRDLLLGVRFVQADGVATWGGSKVVKSVTGYDVPKLMVGALGTLGVLTELTLRLHARPEIERTTLITLPGAAAAQALVAGVLDSALQPNRLEIFDDTALAALGGSRTGVGLAVSFGSVEPAVAAQEAELADRARSAGATALLSAPLLWSSYAGVWRREPVATMLTVGTLPARLGDTLTAVARAARALGPSSRVTTGGCALVGSLRVLVGAAAPDAVADFITRLRGELGGWNGTVIVQGAPREVRTAIDPWGPVPADQLGLMRAIKATFDPEARLNPGRFVGGL